MNTFSQLQWFPVILALMMLMQDHCKFEASQSYIGSPIQASCEEDPVSFCF